MERGLLTRILSPRILMPISAERNEELDRINVHLLGRPYVELNGKRMNFPYKKAEGFFYYLCVKKNATREEIIYVLWGSDNENVGRKNLREAVYQIKKLMGKEILVTEGHTGISLNPDYMPVIDWDKMGEDYIPESEEEGFLSHFHIKNCYEFEEWVSSMQEQYNEYIIKSVRARLHEADKMKDMSQIQKYGNILIKRDPYNEDLYKEIMEIYAAGGNYNMAIKLYYDLEKILAEDLGVEPSGEITEIFHRIFNVKGNVAQTGESWNVSFVGRTEEIYMISQCISGAGYRGKPQCVAIAGEEGVGKTALLNKAAQMVKGYQRVTLHAACYPEEKEYFLRPWNDIFWEIEQCVENGVFEPSLIQEERLQIRQILKGAGAGEELRQPSFQSIERITIEMCRKITQYYKIVLFLDDVQWMDTMSFQLLTRLLLTVGTENILFICTYDKNSDQAVTEAFERLIRQDLIRILVIEPFTRLETEELLHKYLPQLDQEEKDKIYEMSEGNGFFLMEMINLIKEKGFTLEISPKANHVIKARLAGLPEIENEVLNCMSVFPEKIAIEELELLLPELDRLSLIRILEKLQERYLIKESLVGWNIYYEFVHRVFREYVYDRQSMGQRRIYHHMLAEYYENQGKAKRNFRSLPMTIYHYERCHDQAKIYEYKIAYLNEYYTLVNENFPVLHWEMEQGEEDLDSGAGAGQMLELAEEVIRFTEDSPKVQEMKMKMYFLKGRYKIAQGEYDAGLSAIHQSMELAEALQNKRVLLNGYKQMSFYGIQVENPELVKEYLEKGFALLDEGETEDKGVFTRLQGWYYLHKKEYKKAEEKFLEAIEIFKSPGDVGGCFRMSSAACYGYLGDLYRAQGKLEEAAYYYETALKTGTDKVMANGLGQFYSGLGQVRMLQERFREGEELLQKALDCFKHHGYYWGRERAEAYMALLLLKEGRKEEARKYWEESRRISNKIKNPSTELLLQQLAKELK